MPNKKYTLVADGEEQFYDNNKEIVQQVAEKLEEKGIQTNIVETVDKKNK